MNQINLMGFMGQDPILKQSQKQMSYVNFSLSVKRVGKKREYDFFNCVIYDRQAEVFARTIKKGDKIIVSGNVRVNQYEKDGEKRSIFSVNVNAFYYTTTMTKNNNNEESAEEDIKFLEEDDFI